MEGVKMQVGLGSREIVVVVPRHSEADIGSS